MTGVNIHFRGSLTDKRAIRQFIEEVEDIAGSMQWPSQVMDEDWGSRPDAQFEKKEYGGGSVVGKTALKGILFYIHPECAPVNFFFNASCVLASPLQVARSAQEGYPVKPYWQSVNTQPAGPARHAALVRLLHYLKGKYLHDLQVSDESGYWNHGDRGQLERRMAAASQQEFPALERHQHQLEAFDESDVVARIEKVLESWRNKR